MLNCFFIARFTQVKANDKTIAAMKAQTAIEYIKSSNSSDEMNKILKSEYKHNYSDGKSSYYFTDYYDADWNKCNEEEKEYSMKIEVLNYSLNSGEMKNITVTVEKSKPYPFIDKLNGTKVSIITIASKKFFPNFMLGRR